MPCKKKDALLATDIAAALHENRASATSPVNGLLAGQLPRRILLTGIAIAALQPDFAAALSLGDIAVESTLGQPFVATTTARLGPGESLGPDCVTALANMVGGTASNSSLNVSTKAASTPGVLPLQITSKLPLYEPMYEIRLQVKCPGTMNLSRTYFVMLNLPMTGSQNVLSDEPATPDSITVSGIQPGQTRRVVPPNMPGTDTTGIDTGYSAASKQGDTYTVSPAGQPSAAQPDSRPLAAISASTEYRVKRGDTLSAIAQRISGRPVGSTWQVAELIFKENPQAFQNDNPDRLKMGYLLRVPAITALQNVASVTNLVDEAPARSLTRPAGIDRAETKTNTPAISLADTLITNPTDNAASSNQIAQQQTGSIELPASVDAYPVSQSASSPANQPNALQSASVIDLNSARDSQPYTELSEPYSLGNRTEANAAEANSSERGVTGTAGQAKDAAATIANETSSLLAIGLGVLMGILLAGMLVGRKFFLLVLASRTHRNNSQQPVKTKQKPVADDVTTELPVAATEIPAPQIAAEPGEVAAAYIVNEVTEETSEQGLNAALNVDTDLPEAKQAPRINLHESNEDSQIDFDMSDLEEPLEQTEQYSAPVDASSDEDAADMSDMSDMGTMRNLFSPNSIDLTDDSPTTDLPVMADTDATAELPSLTTQPVDTEATSSLQVLSETVSVENPDDHLSQTLTQALGLLERDYEDAMTASQILDQRDIDEALETGASKH